MNENMQRCANLKDLVWLLLAEMGFWPTQDVSRATEALAGCTDKVLSGRSLAAAGPHPVVGEVVKRRPALRYHAVPANAKRGLHQ